MSQGNSWYEKDDLPPVGEFVIFDYEKTPYEIIAHRDGYAIGYKVDAMIRSKTPRSFRPIISEREKAINAAKIVWADYISKNLDASSKHVFSVLYDAGLLKSGE